MNLSKAMELAQRFVRHHDVDCALSYGEPGYSDSDAPNGILFADLTRIGPHGSANKTQRNRWKMKERIITFEQAKARYVYRYTMEHVPQWTGKEHNEKYYAPQYVSDCEWYDNTLFYGETDLLKSDQFCFTSGQSWPLGQWLDKPYRKG